MTHISQVRNYDTEKEYFYRVWGPHDEIEIPAAMFISDTELMKQTIHEGSLEFTKRMVISHVELVDRDSGTIVGHRWLSNNITIDAGGTLEIQWQLDISHIKKWIRLGM